MSYLSRLTPISLLVLCSLYGQTAIAEQPSQQSSPQKTMIVSASKQSRYAASSQDVASWQVSSARLEQANVTNSKELYKVLPGLNINGDHILFPITSLRGVSSAQDFYNVAVTLYIDGIPQPSVGLIQPLGDVKSVELLKGPQGTLYGKAAEGGVVNIVTEQPGSDYIGSFAAGYGSRNNYRGKLNVSGPLVDGLLYGSLFGLREMENGRLTNINTGHKHLGGQANNYGAARLRLAPDNQPWEILTSYSAECTDTSQGISAPLTNLGSSQALLGLYAPDPSVHRCIQNQVFRGNYSTEHWKLTAISSWEQIRMDRIMPPPGAPFHVLYPERWLQDVQEIRLSTLGENNLLDGIVGLYRQNIRQYKGVTRLNNIDNSVRVAKTNSNTQMQSLAAYTDFTWHITKQADAGGGVRLSRDSASTIFNTKDKRTGKGHVSKNHVLGQLSAGYQITPQDRFYLRIAQGYKPTGFDFSPNTGIASPDPYKPETSMTYEIGNKYQSDLINIQGALFYTTTRDLQMYVTEDFGQVLKNIGDARAIGAELAADITPVAGLNIGVSANVINSHFTDDNKNTTYANKRVPYVPEYSGNIHISGNINSVIGTFTPYAALNISGSYSFDDRDIKQTAFTTTDLQLGWQAAERILISAYITNLFDKRVASYAFSRSAFVNMGRTAGVDVKIDLF